MFERADLALGMGANNVVNPEPQSESACLIHRRPILDADKARYVIVIKRSMNPGFAAIDNQLYCEPRCSTPFGNAKGAISKLVATVKARRFRPSPIDD